MKIKDSELLLGALVQALQVLREPDPRTVADARTKLAALRGIVLAPAVVDIVAACRPSALLTPRNPS